MGFFVVGRSQFGDAVFWIVVWLKDQENAASTSTKANRRWLNLFINSLI
jgi:hypothetical protein